MSGVKSRPFSGASWRESPITVVVWISVVVSRATAAAETLTVVDVTLTKSESYLQGVDRSCGDTNVVHGEHRKTSYGNDDFVSAQWEGLEKTN